MLSSSLPMQTFQYGVTSWKLSGPSSTYAAFSLLMLQLLESDIRLLRPILLLFVFGPVDTTLCWLGRMPGTTVNHAFVCLCKAEVWSLRTLSCFTKLQLFQSIVISLTFLLYGAETRALLNKHCAALCIFYELPKAHLWHIFEEPHLKCSHPVNVSNMFHGLPTEEQEA